jgi:hypothetical protein
MAPSSSQLARQARLLVFGHALQVSGQGGQLARAGAHLAVEPRAFLFQFGPGGIGHCHAARVAHAERHHQYDVDGREQPNAVARQLQVMLGRFEIVRDRARLAHLQMLETAPAFSMVCLPKSVRTMSSATSKSRLP